MKNIFTPNLYFLAIISLFFITIISCDQFDRNKFSDRLISEATAHTLSENFKMKYEPCDTNDAIQTSAWFPDSVLVHYLAYAKHIGDSLGIHSSGVRVYFGVYPESDEKRRGKLTVFFAPTFYDSKLGGNINDEKNHTDIVLTNPSTNYLLNFGNMGYPPKTFPK